MKRLMRIVVIAGIGLGFESCAPVSPQKRQQVDTAQDGLLGEYGYQRIQRRKNIEAR